MLSVALSFRECKNIGIHCWLLCFEEIAFSISYILLLVPISNSLLVVGWLAVCLLCECQLFNLIVRLFSLFHYVILCLGTSKDLSLGV